MTPGSKLVAVNGRQYSKELLQDVLNAGGTEPRTISLLMDCCRSSPRDTVNRLLADEPGIRRDQRGDVTRHQIIHAILATHGSVFRC